MNSKNFIAVYFIMFGLAFPLAVSAEDFTFNVGVNLSNMHPEIVSMKLRCSAKQGPNVIIGTGENAEKISADGTFNATVPVSFNADSGKNPADATVAICILHLGLRNGTFLQAFAANDSIICDDPDRYPVESICSKPGTEIRTAIQENFLKKK